MQHQNRLILNKGDKYYNEDWFIDVFLQGAMNNFIEGYSIVKYCQEIGFVCNTIMNSNCINLKMLKRL
jgi:hypothetical protein